MAEFENAVSYCNSISSLLDSYCARKDQTLALAHSEEAREINACDTALSEYLHECSILTERNELEKNGRIAQAHARLDEARRLLDSISDPNWHRVRRQYYESTNSYASVDRYRETPAEELATDIDGVVSKLRTEILQLNNAFTPPGVSNIIGKAIPAFRKARYTRIAQLRNSLIGVAAALCDCSDLATRQSKLNCVFEEVQNKLEERRVAHIRQIHAIASDNISRGTEELRRQLCASEPYRELQNPMPFQIGQYVYLIKDNSDAPINSNESAKPLLTLPVSCSGFEKSSLFQIHSETHLEGFFAQLALDILSYDMNAHVAVIDVTGLGKKYSALGRLSNMPQFDLLSTADQVQMFLEAVERIISEAYAGKMPSCKTYIFVDNFLRNTPDRCMESLARIISNGAACGVYVLASIREKDAEDRRWSNLLAQLEVCRYDVCSNRLLTGSGFIVLHFETNISSRASSLAVSMKQRSESASVIPIWKSFPQAENWQTCCSATGISVPIGINAQTGTLSLFNLTEERPYALIVGDVDVGKSSALHCLALQIMARYSPAEVRIAIGDFKDGSEFNTYVKSGVRSVDAVVNSQDPDSMSSFLGFYVAEMHRRQMLFNQTSELCGRMIRKYETYREACRDTSMVHVPRICLIIDEFQSLFDSPAAGTSSLLSELVRKGRTYGVHIIMASQRAVSDNPRNGFTAELKNYFTSRMVFRCPQQTARTMLAERCADTGRENSGIPGASLLKKGHCIFNTYQGQNECDNSYIQCFYASDAAIEKTIRVLKSLNGTSRHGVLLMQDAPSVPAPARVDGYILLGDSARLRYDETNHNRDVFRDNSVVALDLGAIRSNLVVAGNDLRVHASIFRSVLAAAPFGARINLFGAANSTLMRLLHPMTGDRVNYYPELKDLAFPELEVFTINLIIEPEKVPEVSQAGTLRRTAAMDQFDRILDLPEGGRGINVIFSGSFKLFKTNLSYAVAKAPLRIIGVGDQEELRLIMGDAAVMARSDFDIPAHSAVKAYYHNKASGKTGKILLYQ